MLKHFGSILLFLLSSSRLLASEGSSVSGPYFYLSCDSLGRELNAKSRLSCEDSSCIYQSLVYTVGMDVSDAMNGSMEGAVSDTCRLIKTSTLDVLDASAETIVPYVERSGGEASSDHLNVPEMGRFYPGSSFTVNYPTPGTYKIWITRARSAMRIEAVAP